MKKKQKKSPGNWIAAALTTVAICYAAPSLVEAAIVMIPQFFIIRFLVRLVMIFFGYPFFGHVTPKMTKKAEKKKKQLQGKGLQAT